MKTNRKNRNLITLISPIITAFMILTVFAAFGIFPFGQKTISWCDLDQQTVPLLMQLKDILSGNGSLFYSPSNGGGMNFWGVFLFFLSSPFYLAVAFVKKADMIYFANIIFIIKLSAAAAIAAFYFSGHHRRLPPAICVIFSVMYALCGYGLMYYQSLMWLDIMCLFPLLVISVQRICRTGRSGMYFTVVSLMMIMNFYLSFMVVIYLIISVPLYITMVCEKNRRKKAAASFAVSSAAAAMFTAPVWLCAYMQVSASARGNDSFAEFILSPITESFSEKLSVLMCTAVIFAVLPFLPRIDICKRKAVRYKLVLLAFLAIPVVIDPINKIWHTGSYQSFPLRYGYIIIFTALTLAADVTEELISSSKNTHTKPIYIVPAAVLTAFYGAISYIQLKAGRLELEGYLKALMKGKSQFSLLFALFILAAVLYFDAFLLLYHKHLGKKGFSAVLASVFAVEFAVNSAVYVGFAANDGIAFQNALKAESAVASDGLYRTKAEKKYLHANMLGALGGNSMAHYTSLTPQDYMFAMKKMGYSSYWMEVSPNGGTVLTDALLAIKYSFGVDYDFASYQTNIGDKSTYTIAQSDIVCSPGIISRENPESVKTIDYTDRKTVQKQLSEGILHSRGIVSEYGFTVISGNVEYSDGRYNITTDPDSGCCIVKYNIDIDRSCQLYFDIFDSLSNRLEEKYYGSAEVYVDGRTVNKSYPTQRSNGFLKLGEFSDESVEISVIINKDISVSSFGVIGIDTENLKNAINRLKMTEPYCKGSKIYAECSAESGEFLYLSIPWDRGFTAYVNGQKTELYKVYDSFCALKLENGSNSIKLVYYPPGFKLSLVFSTAGILIFAADRLRKKDYPKAVLKISSGIVGTLFCLTAVILYIMAPLISLIGIFI